MNLNEETIQRFCEIQVKAQRGYMGTSVHGDIGSLLERLNKNRKHGNKLLKVLNCNLDLGPEQDGLIFDFRDIRVEDTNTGGYYNIKQYLVWLFGVAWPGNRGCSCNVCGQVPECYVSMSVKSPNVQDYIHPQIDWLKSSPPRQGQPHSKFYTDDFNRINCYGQFHLARDIATGFVPLVSNLFGFLKNTGDVGIINESLAKNWKSA